MTNTEKILKRFQTFLKKEKLDLFVVNSTDEYLSEYVDMQSNSRYLLTGFSGSAGDMIVTQEEAMLFIDGRYHLQAENEVNPELVSLIKVGLGTSPQRVLYEKLAELCGINNTNIGIVSSKTSCAGFKELLKNLEGRQNIKIFEYEQDPIAKIAGIKEKTKTGGVLRYIPEEISGTTPENKLESVNKYKTENNIDLLLVADLANIAYLANLRGAEIPYSSCFKAKSVIFRGKAYIFTDLNNLPVEIIDNFSEKFVFQQEKDFEGFIKNLSKEQVANVYYHPGSTTLAVFRKVEKLADKVVEIKESFISSLKAIKTRQEMGYMAECYLKTDIVVNRVICWLNQNLESGEKISEKDFSEKVKSLFKEEGAVGLSFEPITASGKNTAFIHYTHPDPEKAIKPGDFILLDCGAYFEGGYATDQTRTFLAGGGFATAEELQKTVYTSVLKGFLHGLNLEIKENTTGYDLDNAVREVVDSCKPEGFSFSHATGHGVGIPVHEDPPRIGPSESSKIPLKAGMVFTIEPGLYNESYGGVRIENTVTAVKEDGSIKIRTLTKAPLDENLINYDMLTEQEKIWLKDYNRFKIG